jgi:hypothetical protein
MNSYCQYGTINISEAVVVIDKYRAQIFSRGRIVIIFQVSNETPSLYNIFGDVPPNALKLLLARIA